MVNLDLGGNGDIHAVTEDVVNEAIESLENPIQKDLVLKCLDNDPLKRPTARELLFHPALFEIPTLKLLSAHSLTDDIRKQKTNFSFFYNR
jgi:nuclear receptor-binding protein